MKKLILSMEEVGNRMEIITSETNKDIKKIIGLLEKSKNRRKEDSYVVEGLKMVFEIPKEDIREVYISKTCYENIASGNVDKRIVDVKSFNKDGESELGFPYKVISDALFKKISDTVTPQGILAIVKRKHYKLNDILNRKVKKDGLPDKQVIMILDDLRDPGNLGTIIRTCEAAGVSGIILSKESVDIYNPKVVRSTMGAILRVPFYESEDLKEDIKKIKQENFKLYAAHLGGKKLYNEVKKDGAYGFIIGNEANGISDEVAALADELVIIPMYGNVESLNAAIAASILMFS